MSVGGQIEAALKVIGGPVVVRYRDGSCSGFHASLQPCRTDERGQIPTETGLAGAAYTLYAPRGVRLSAGDLVECGGREFVVRERCSWAFSAHSAYIKAIVCAVERGN